MTTKPRTATITNATGAHKNLVGQTLQVARCFKNGRAYLVLPEKYLGMTEAFFFADQIVLHY
jgi:hypothetical protein